MKSDLVDEKSTRPVPADRPIDVLDFLEAENTKLRTAVIELSLDMLVLKDALKGKRWNAA
jgi:hypothetical protein